jgi:predicted acyltransferase
MKQQRFYSLDVFRGATVALMILVNNPGSWSHLYSPLAHAPWHGLTPTDLVFPFFLFAVGNAMAFVMPRLQQAGDAAFWKKVITRTALIFLIGLFLNWFPFVRWQDGRLVVKTWTWLTSEGNLSGIRILGVLQRIALCYFFASVIVYYAKARGAFWIGLILLVIYWLLCIAGNPTDPYSLAGWFGTAVDKQILGEAHMYHGEGIAFDPEGIVSTLPAIVQVIFGFLVGDYLRTRGKNTEDPEKEINKGASNPFYKTLTVLFIAAMFFLFVGYVWGLSFPINKKIWTSSYVVLTTGLAVSILATLVYFIEVKKARGWWSSFFNVFGKNPLFIFALSGLIPKLMGIIHISNGTDETGKALYTTPWSWFHQNVTSKFPGPPENGSLLFAICVLAILWAIGYWMHRRKIYIRV